MGFRAFGQPIPPFGEVFGQAGGTRTLNQLILSLNGADIIGHWSLGDSSGTVATDSSTTGANGAYDGTVTLAQPGVGDGSLSALFAGGRVTFSAPNAGLLNTAFADKSRGTLVAFCKASGAALWTDGNIRYIAQIGTDANNRIILARSAGNGALQGLYVAGGASKQVVFASGSPLTWFSLGITWDLSAGINGECKVFFNGAQVGVTQTALGTWAGALSASWCAIADVGFGGATDRWTGNEAHIVLWQAPLTPAQMSQLVVP